jgi:hypothetical protein
MLPTDHKDEAHIPLDTEFKYIPTNPYTIQGSIDGGVSESFPGDEPPLPPKSFLKGFLAEGYELNATVRALHAGYENVFEKPNPLDDIAPPGWKPNTPEMLNGIRDQYLSHMLEATGPKDQQFRKQQILFEQEHDDNLENGSFMGKALGGLFIGIGADPTSYIPIAGWAKYAKLAPTVLKTMARTLPGVATMSVLKSGAEQMDKVNGNLQDFFVGSMLDTVFATSLFGIGGAAGLFTEKMNVLNLKNIAKNYIDGIDFKLTTDAEGKLNGIKAIDSTGKLSAAKVDLAQQMADSSFHQGGLFKIPYIGKAAYNVLANVPGLGVPLLKMLNSPYQSVRGAIDRMADHGLITQGIAEGKEAPVKFSSLMNQEYAELRSIEAQITALHLERNGFNIKNRAAGGLINLAMNAKGATYDKLKSIAKENSFVNKDTFYSEVDHVLYTEESSEHAAVNEAASILAKKRDQVYKDYRIANNLPPDWLPPKMAKGHSMRVYDTQYMNNHENDWIEHISQSYKESDEFIQSQLAPIDELDKKIKMATDAHLSLSKSNNVKDTEIKSSANSIKQLKLRKKALSEKLQNEMRTNESLYPYVENWHDLSADEAKELKGILKPVAQLKKDIKEAKLNLAASKKVTSQKVASTQTSKTAKGAKKQVNLSEMSQKDSSLLESKVRELEDKLQQAEDAIQIQIQNGQINPRFYNKVTGSQQYALKKTSQRLSFRKTLANDFERRSLAKHQYNSIMNQTAEDTINQVLGGFVSKGGSSPNPLMARSVLVPDEVLYQNNFMSKDLMAKFSNYVTFLARRTHLKKAFGDLSEDGTLQPLIETFNNEHESYRKPLNENIKKLEEDLKKESLDTKQKNMLEKKITSARKELDAKKIQFETGKKQLNHMFSKMMGVSSYSYSSRKWQRGIMAFTSMANLPFVPFLMLNDLSNIPLKAGLTAFVRDSVYPLLESLGGILKTKDSEAFRKAAPSIHLALQDITTGYADRNWSMQTNPYVNMGKIVNSLEWLAHSNSNFTLTNYIDNYLQRMAASAHQSEFMRILHASDKGKMTKKEETYLLKYGLDPKKWAKKMVKQFKNSGGAKTKLGGYQSMFWRWADSPTSNKFGDALFRAVKDTMIQRDLADAPMWADNPIGGLIFGFQGWTFASLNRFVVPSMQEPDARKLIGIMTSIATGALVDPMRRMARGDEPLPESLSNEEFMSAAIQNSGYFSYFMMVLQDANVLTGGNLLGNLRSDRYKDRTRIGLMGPSFGNFNRMFDIMTALGSGEFNKADAKKMARMVPYANASWTYWLSNKMIQGLDIPETRADARALNNSY